MALPLPTSQGSAKGARCYKKHAHSTTRTYGGGGGAVLDGAAASWGRDLMWVALESPRVAQAGGVPLPASLQLRPVALSLPGAAEDPPPALGGSEVPRCGHISRALCPQGDTAAKLPVRH